MYEMPTMSPLTEHMLPVIQYLELMDAAPALVDRVRKLVAEHEAAQEALAELRKADSARVGFASDLLTGVSARLAADVHPRDALNWVTDELEKALPF